MTKYVVAQSEATDVLADANETAPTPGEVVLGRVIAIDTAGNPLISYPQLGDNNSLAALSTLPITHQHIGRQVALLFTNRDYRQPVIMGLLNSPLHDLLESFVLTKSDEDMSNDSPSSAQGSLPAEDASGVDKEDASGVGKDENTVRVDGRKIVIEGQEEIVFTCGQASITLTKAGKILIRGKYLLSRSSGVNRIQGGSVQVN